MTKTSLDKSKIKIVLLEGIHLSAVEAFRNDGYTDIEHHPKSLPPDQLRKALADAYFIGIRSATELTAEVLDAAPRLIGVGADYIVPYFLSLPVLLPMLFANHEPL